jgi:hypothetical protein
MVNNQVSASHQLARDGHQSLPASLLLAKLLTCYYTTTYELVFVEIIARL